MTHAQAPRSRGRRIARWVVITAAVAVIGYALAMPLLRFAGRQMVDVDPPQRSDAILVTASSLDRVVEAAELYRQGYAPLVLLTLPPRDNAETFLLARGIAVDLNEVRRKRILEALGVPGDAIVFLPDLVGSTADEARAFAKWADGRPIRSLTIVTSPYHTGRTRLTFEHMLDGKPIAVRLHAATLIPFDPDTWWRDRDRLRNGIIELQKLVYYRLFEL